MKISAILSLAAVIGTVSIFISINKWMTVNNTVSYESSPSHKITIIESTPQQKIPLTLPINSKAKISPDQKSA